MKKNFDVYITLNENVEPTPEKPKSKMFSVVELTAEDGESVEFVAPGMPQDEEDIYNLDVGEAFLEYITQDQMVSVKVSTYVYGEGETVPADNLDEIRENFDSWNRCGTLDCIRENTFSMDLEQNFLDSFDEVNEDDMEL